MTEAVWSCLMSPAALLTEKDVKASFKHQTDSCCNVGIHITKLLVPNQSAVLFPPAIVMAARQHERLPSNPSNLTFLFSPDNKMGPGTRLKSCLIFSAIITRQQLKRTKHNLLKLIVFSTKGKYDWMWPTHCSARCVAAGRELKPSATNPDRSVSSNMWCVSLNFSSAATFFFLAFSASWGEAETHYPLYNHSACVFRARYVSSSVRWKFTWLSSPAVISLATLAFLLLWVQSVCYLWIGCLH